MFKTTQLFFPSWTSFEACLIVAGHFISVKGSHYSSSSSLHSYPATKYIDLNIVSVIYSIQHWMNREKFLIF